MSSHRHDCPQHQCTCSEVHDLAELYRDLKCQRQLAKEQQQQQQDNGEKEEGRVECISPEKLQMTRGQAEHVLGIVRTQREGVRNLMTALREFSQKLSRQEEMVCQTDKEIAKLWEEMRRIKEQYNNDKRQDVADATETMSAEEVAWRQAVDSEIQEQCRLKRKIAQLTECLETRRQCDRASDAERQEERKTDAKLLLAAMDYVERCLQDKTAPPP